MCTEAVHSILMLENACETKNANGKRSLEWHSIDPEKSNRRPVPAISNVKCSRKTEIRQPRAMLYYQIKPRSFIVIIIKLPMIRENRKHQPFSTNLRSDSFAYRGQD